MPSLPAPAFVRHWLLTLGQGLLDLVYPARCVGCHNRTDDPHLPLCIRCIRQLETTDAAAVTAALHSFDGLDPDRTTGFALWRFDKGGTLQRVQHALKYQNRPAYGRSLGRLIGEAYQAATVPLPDLIVPVPLHRQRLLERGYNQSAYLARGLGEVLDVPVLEAVLKRSVPTRSQTHLSAGERWENVRAAFTVVRPDAVGGRRVLLVDDVMTTGATAAAALRALHRAGAPSTHLAALAFAR